MDSMGRTVPARLFVNPAAGCCGAARKMAEARDAFAQINYWLKIVETDSVAGFRRAVREAMNEGCTTLIAMGGDGTLQLLANEMMAEKGVIGAKGVIGRDVLLGVIPAGGGNDFAMALGIPGSSISECIIKNAPPSTHSNVLWPWNVVPGMRGWVPTVFHLPTKALKGLRAASMSLQARSIVSKGSTRRPSSINSRYALYTLGRIVPPAVGITVCLGSNGGIVNVVNDVGGQTGCNVSFTPTVTSYP